MVVRCGCVIYEKGLCLYTFHLRARRSSRPRRKATTTVITKPQTQKPKPQKLQLSTTDCIPAKDLSSGLADLRRLKPWRWIDLPTYSELQSSSRKETGSEGATGLTLLVTCQHYDSAFRSPTYVLEPKSSDFPERRLGR